MLAALVRLSGSAGSFVAACLFLTAPCERAAGDEPTATVAKLDGIKQVADKAYERLMQRQAAVKAEAAKKAALVDYWREIRSCGRMRTRGRDEDRG